MRRLATMITLAAFVTLMGTAAFASSATFSIDVPNFGSQTQSGSHTTVDNNNRIDTKYSQNAADSNIKPVRCSDGTDISGFKFVTAGNHTLQTLANSVVHGVCFKLNIDTPQCCNSFVFKGTEFF